MKYSAEHWEEKRRKGLGRFLLFDGILLTGGPFAVVMQIVGYFLFGDQYQSFGEYFTASKTWMTFMLHGVGFGLVMGLINWRRNERAVAKPSDEGQNGA